MILYTKTNCPMCDILKQKLNIKNISFEEWVDKAEEVKAMGFMSFPILKLDNGKTLSFSHAVEYINSL